MYDDKLLRERLESILEVLERIPKRFQSIYSPDDFTDTEDGRDRMDAICMALIAVGESFKSMDKKTDGKLLATYPNINWRGIIAVRDFLAHGYFQVNSAQLYGICKDDVPELIQTVRKMISDLK